MNIIICDDLPLFAHSLRTYIEDYKFENVNIKCFSSGKEVLYYINDKNAFDVMFIDICLGTESGIDLAYKIKRLYPHSLLVFISYFDNFFSELVNVEPFGFIKKPLQKESVFNVLERITERMKSTIHHYYYFISNGVTHRIDLNDVIYVTSMNRIILIRTKNSEEYQFYDKLDIVYHNILELYPYFARINKSYIVNLIYVEKHSIRYVYMSNNETINRSKKYDLDFANKINEFQNK